MARGGYPTVCGYGESRGSGQETKDLDAKEPRRDTKDDARTRRDATVLEQMGLNAAEAAQQNEVYDQAVGTYVDLTCQQRTNNLEGR